VSSLKFTIIQTALSWEDKGANLEALSKKIMAITEPTEIIVLPEMFTTGFSMQPALFAETMEGPTVQWMLRLAETKKSIITGSVIIEENGNYYNRLIWMLPNGQLGYYDKRHLFAFAGEHEFYSEGNKRLNTSGGTNVENTNVPDLEYDILLYVANWPEKRNHAWKTLITARSIENQCYTIGVNRVGLDGKNIMHSGDSMVVGPLGEVLYHCAYEEDVFHITLQKEELIKTRAQFPFWKNADFFNIEL
jgi:omega-amidase